MNMQFDHVAINVRNVAASVDWYRTTLRAKLLYQDTTWAFLEVAGVRLALTLRSEHPPHLAFDVGSEPSAEFLRKAKAHRDGTVSQYIVDPDGNAIEWIHYPDGANKAIRKMKAVKRQE
jgi:catechol 2,3-dioxygenase-like lactoylglutathione lyase family enzyme